MRRTKEGLRMTAEEKAAFAAWFDAELALAA
jgi:glycerol-3-phosphate dehydrogenase